MNNKKKDKKALTDQPNASQNIFTRFKKLSFLTRTPHERISKPNDPPLLPASSEETSSLFPTRELPCRRFTIAQIRSATKDFDDSMLIRVDRYVDEYKGIIDEGRTVVSIIKAPFITYFHFGVEMLFMLQHRNIVRLIGYCDAGRDRILVYEYMSNGTLSDHLYKHPTPLSWSQRLKICIDVASAINYLHYLPNGQGVIHGNLNSSTILLDNQWEAKVRFTGLQYSRVMPVISRRATPSSSTTSEIVEQFISMQNDVYSFGVVLLEVLCRRPDHEGEKLVEWAKYCLRTRQLEQIMDTDLRGQISLKCLNNYARIVEWCLHVYEDASITMDEVVTGLESILALHERTDNSIPQMGITTTVLSLDWRLQRFFQNSGVSHATWDAHMDYIPRADLLTRMKDFLHLLWFYPVKKEAQVNFGSLVDKFSLLNKYIRKSKDSRDREIMKEIRTLLQDVEEHLDVVEEHLDDVAFEIMGYLPEGLEPSTSVATVVPNSRQVLSASFWSDIPEIHASAIASASHRALRCIKDLKVKKLGISGTGAEEVAETLKDTPELRREFDMVLCVRATHHGIQELILDIKEEILLSRKKRSETGDLINVPDEFLNCLLLVDYRSNFIDLHEVELFMLNWFQTVQIVMTNGPQNVYFQVDLEIRIQDHFLPWLLFSTHVDLATMDNYHTIQPMVTRLVEECHGHLLAIILLARALRGTVDVSAWELAIQDLASQQEPSSSESSITSDVMVRVLRFVWSRKETMSQRCIIQFALGYKGRECENSSLIHSWMRDGLVKGEQEGQHVFDDLVRSFLLEPVGEYHVRMRDETRDTLVAYFAPLAYGLHLKQDGSESNKMSYVEEWDAREIHLSNNILSELPDSPNCPILVNLSLYSNQDLMDIPIAFFDHMPSLQVLDFSNTSIKHLPSSISKLTSLRQLIMRDCHLLMDLPPEIGELTNLKVFDAEGTQLVYLPPEFGSLIKLECLKFSLYIYADRYKQSKQIMQIIPATALSKLIWLRELSICIDLYGEWWEDEAKLIIDVLSKLRTLKSLKLYFPNTELLHLFMEQQDWEGVPIYPHLSNFSFTVGRLQQRVMSCLPLGLDKMFQKQPKCLKYTNGEGDTEVIAMALEHAHALFLDRHWTIPSLSTFGAAEMKRLKFCLLSECNEMLEIVDGSYLYKVGGNGSRGSFIGPVLRSLEYLAIHHMKSLSCIWKGPIHSGCLINLKTLVINGCPELRTILTEGLLDNLTSLEYLIVQDCANVNSLISSGSSQSTSTRFLPRLKKMSLLQLPELVSISDGISIGPRLESLVIYDCPNLEKLSYMEVSDDIKEIKGENEWWDALKWCEPEWSSGRPDYLASVFSPLGTDDDIMDELADATNYLPQLSG